jgi:hypothetical protein
MTLDEKKAFARLYLNAALGLALSTIQRKESVNDVPESVPDSESQAGAAEPGT